MADPPAADTSCSNAQVMHMTGCRTSPAESRDGGPSPFTIRLDLIAGRLELAGPLDHRTAHLLHDAISTLLLTDCHLWTIDVTELTACQSSGLRAIGGTYRRALRHNRWVRLTGTPPWLQRDLTRVHLDHHLLGDGQGRRSAGPPEPVAGAVRDRR